MDQIIDQLKHKIRNKISDLNFNTWFRPIAGAYVQDQNFVLKVPNKFIADWISDYYSDCIKSAVHEITNQPLNVSFEIAPQEFVEIEAPKEELKPENQKIKLLEQLNTKFTFDRFVVGSSNQFAHAACKAVADLPGGHYNPLFIYGGVGLGKTHLMHAIGVHLQTTRPGSQLIYMSAERFMNELINSLRYEKTSEFRSKFRDKCDVLLIDDIQFLAGKERTQEEFFHTFNALHEAQKQIVVTSDKLPKDIPGLEERLRSRFEWGLIADIQPPDLETRIAILKKKADTSGVMCPDDVAMFLASSISSNVRELEGSLIRLNAFASLAGSAITVDLAREVLGNLIRDEKKIFSIEAIQKTVASYYNINVSDLKSPRRAKSLSHPRQVAMYLCKKHVRSSFPEIGGKFGGKDHTTVMYACKKIESLIQTDTNIKEEVSALEKSLLN